MFTLGVNRLACHTFSGVDSPRYPNCIVSGHQPHQRRHQVMARSRGLWRSRPWQLVTVGDRSFLVTGPRTWNNLPVSIRSAPSLLSFTRQLKTCLFSRRYTWHCLSKPNVVDLAVFFNLGHFKKLLYITLQIQYLQITSSLSYHYTHAPDTGKKKVNFEIYIADGKATTCI